MRRQPLRLEAGRTAAGGQERTLHNQREAESTGLLTDRFDARTPDVHVLDGDALLWTLPNLTIP